MQGHRRLRVLLVSTVTVCRQMPILTGSVRVTANDCGARKGESLLGADNMNDTCHQYNSSPCANALTLPLVVHTKVGETKLLDVILERSNLSSTVWLSNESSDALEILSGNRTGRVSPQLISIPEGS
jgi:hypothetical protein